MSQAVLAVSNFFVVFYIIKLLLSRPKPLDFPVVEASSAEYKSAVLEATLKV